MADAAFNFTTAVQRKILAVLWHDVQSFNTYRDCIKPKYFTKRIEMDICRILFDYYKKYNKPPTQDVLTEEILKLCESNSRVKKLESQYLEAIDEIANAELYDYEYIRDKILAFGKKQAMVDAIMEAAEVIEKGNIDDFSKVTKLIESAQMVGEDLNDLGLDYWDNYEERLASYQDEEDVIERFPTGMEAFDGVLKGGLGRTEMGVVLAPPGRGKTTFMINCGANALRLGKNVVHISLENNDAQIIRNYDLRMLGKNLEYIKNNLDKCYKSLGFAKRYSNGNLFIKKYPTKKVTVDNIRMYLNRLVAVKGIQLDMVIIDYGAILKPMTNWNDKRNTIESNYEDMRALADEFNVALWTGAQGNRMSLSKKVVTMEDLAEAFAIANTSDVMIALCQTVREKTDGVMRAFVTKNRDGIDGILLKGKIDYESKKLTLDEDVTRSMLSDSDDDEDEDDGWKDTGRKSKRVKEE